MLPGLYCSDLGSCMEYKEGKELDPWWYIAIAFCLGMFVSPHLGWP